MTLPHNCNDSPPLGFHRGTPSVRQVQIAVCQEFGVEHIEMLSARRSKAIVTPRHIAIYLARHLTFYSLPNIGRFFGGRDHTTVINAVRQTERMIAADEAMRSRITTLELRILSTVDGLVSDNPASDKILEAA